jgi:hypothetical protein
MSAPIEKHLIDCLAALDQGESLELILARYPVETTRQLQPMLETASKLSRLPLGHTLAAQISSRHAFLEEAALMREGKNRQPSRTAAFLPRWLPGLASMALVLFLLLAAFLYLPQRALPGDPLYGAKRATENVRLALTGSTSGRQRLEAQFRRERLREIESLLALGREADVAFSGRIEAIQPHAWQIAGFTLEITGATLIQGEPRLGYYAHVAGRTSQGRLIARTITVETVPERPLPPTPSPLPTAPSLLPTPAANTPPPAPSATVTPQPSPSATATFQASPTTTRTPSPVPTAVLTESPWPTSTPPAPIATPVPPPTWTPPPPTATATPGDNNDNDNDNDNDNSNSNSNSNSNDNSNDNDNNGDDDDDDDDDGDDNKNENGDDKGGQRDG